MGFVFYDIWFLSSVFSFIYISTFLSFFSSSSELVCGVRLVHCVYFVAVSFVYFILLLFFLHSLQPCQSLCIPSKCHCLASNRYLSIDHRPIPDRYFVPRCLFFFFFQGLLAFLVLLFFSLVIFYYYWQSYYVSVSHPSSAPPLPEKISKEVEYGDLP